MNKVFGRLRHFGVAIALVFFIAAPLVALPKPTGYVVDEMGLLTAMQKQGLTMLSTELEQKTTAQLATLVVATTGDEPIDSYSVKVFEAWKLGQKGKSNGVLLVVAVKDRKAHIEVGYGLEGAIPDGKAGEIIREAIIPYAKTDLAAGVYAGHATLAQVISKEYGAVLSGKANAPLQRQRAPLGPIQIIVMLIIFIALSMSKGGRLLLLGLLGSGILGGGGRGGFGSFGGGGGFGGFGGGGSGGGGASGRW